MWLLLLYKTKSMKITESRLSAGPDLNPIGPCSVKIRAPPSHKFSDINVQKHSVDTCELYAIGYCCCYLNWEWRHGFLHSKALCRLIAKSIRWSKLVQHYNTARKFKVQQFWIACGGPLFVGAPVRPKMLNMPKSVSACQSQTVCLNDRRLSLLGKLGSLYYLL